MSQKKDIKTVHNFTGKDGKPGAIWTKIGSAVSMDGNRWRLNFTALPLSWRDGIFLMDPYNAADNSGGGGGGGGNYSPPPPPTEDWD
jgi:hypothetical protein